MGCERAHTECFGQGEGLVVMGCGLLALRGIALHGDVAEETQGIRLAATFLVGLSQFERTLGQGTCLLQTVGEQGHFAQPEDAEGLVNL
jgi:hypothetical protein